MFCADDRVLYREMAASTFYGLTERGDTEDPSIQDLVEYGSSLWSEPSETFRAGFRAYLAEIESDRYAPLSRTGGGTYTLAEERCLLTCRACQERRFTSWFGVDETEQIPWSAARRGPCPI